MVGRGCFVAPLKPADLAGKRDRLAVDKLKKDIEYYKSLGLSLEELVALVNRYYSGED
jgi:GntR family transcriptional regulator